MLIRKLSQYLCLAAVTLLPTLTLAAPPGSIDQTSYYIPEPVEAAVQRQCNDGVCRVFDPAAQGACRDGSCNPNSYGNLNGNGAYGESMGPACRNGQCPSFSAQPWYPTADCYAGKPYTFGDLACDWRAMKSSCDGMNPCSNSRGNSCLHDWWCNEKQKMHCRQQYRNQVVGAHLHNKFNYFTPSGNGGEGVAPFGCYRRVYAASPGYYDARDKQIYAAAGTGVPTAVPLPPGVRYQYNYGWGMPSSRVTQISTISPPR